VTTTQRSPLVPELPTMTEAGVPGYEAVTILGIFSPGATPAALVQRLHQDTARALRKVEVKDRLFAIGMEVVAGPPDQLLEAMRGEMTKWGKLIKEAGIRSE
jgi:tripartite-type tricarboxylate transporter receptor subunit TctC